MLTGIVSLASVGAAEPFYVSDKPDIIVYKEQSWGALGLGTAAYMPGGAAPMVMQINDKTYAKGLGSHAPGQIIIELRGLYQAFEAEVGLQKQPGDCGSVAFEAYVDDEKVFESPVMRATDAPEPVRLSLTGADELKLVLKDGGDGISCDLGNWADARLIPDPNAKPLEHIAGVDVGQFARIVSWDPAKMEGTKAGRVEEIPAEDLFPETEILPGPDGLYAVPANACIGLQWGEPRHVRTLRLDFADAKSVPPPDSVRVQYWGVAMERGASSGSRWQGVWKPLKGDVRRDGAALVVDADWSGNEDKTFGATQVRWVLPDSAAKAKVARPSAYTDSRWTTTEIILQAENASPGARAQINAYNVEITNGSTGSISADWDLSKPITLTVRHGIPRRWMFDRGSLRISIATLSPSKDAVPNSGILSQSKNAGFGIAIDDLLNHGCVYVEDFGVFASLASANTTLAQYKQKIAGQKTVLERVREMPDQTFEQAMKHVHRPEGDHGPTILSLAAENHKYLIHRDGSIRFDLPDYPWKDLSRKQLLWTLSRSCGVGGEQKITRAPEEGWLPITNIRVEESGIVYKQRTYLAPVGAEPAGQGKLAWLNSKPLCVSEFVIDNPTGRAADVSVRFNVTPLVDKNVPPKEPTTLDVKGPLAVYSADGKPFVWVSSAGAAPLAMKIADGVATISGRLPANSSARCATFIPGWENAAAEMAAMSDTAPLLEKTKAYWRDVTAEETTFEIPDKMLSDIIKASQVHCLLAARSEEDSRVAAWIGAVNYGPLESEAHSVIRGMLYTGNAEYARRSLDFFIHRYNPQGFLTTGYTVMGTGWHLWTLGEYYALTRDKEWMNANASEVARVCKWVMAQREKTKKLDARGEKVPEWGLTTPGVCADWSVYQYYMYINGNYYAGLKSAGEALADIGHPDADAILANAQELRECIWRAYKNAQSLAPVFPLRDGTWVPMYPTQAFSIWPTNQMYPASDSGRSWCYDVEIGAHHLIPMGVMDPDSDDARWMMDHEEDVQFLESGWFYYPKEGNEKDWFNLGGFAKVQPYYARTGEVHCKRDDVKPFIRTYFNSLISLLNREDLSLWEHFINGAFNKTHETGYFLYDTRTMFVTERGTELWIAPFVTNNWLKDGLSVGVKRADTVFGHVSYRITSHVNQGYIDAEIAVPARQTPSEIVVRLRHPEGKQIKSVIVNGAPHTDFDPAREIVRIKPRGDKIVVRAEF
jgi:hypothetical protein